jgi:O-antigen/teichoic acid export membrane protein
VYRPRELMAFSGASWMASLTSTGLIWADTIILGIYRSSADVGIYNAATRLVVLATFVMAPINASFAPRIADLYQRGMADTLRRTYGVATSWIVRLSLPAFIVLVLFPKQLLRIFGTGFRAGATVTVLLAVGKLIDAGTGPCGLVLNMSGRAALNMINNVAALGLNIGLNILLIPRHGIVGAAAAWAISLAAVNLVRVLQVRRLMGMLPFDVGVVRGGAAGAVAFAVGLATRQLLDGATALLVAMPLLLAAYVGAIGLLGLREDDRLVLRMLARRPGPDQNPQP